MIDVFRIGVNILFSSNEGAVIGTMLRHLLRVEASTKHINDNIGRMRILAAGAVSAFAGFAALRGIHDLIESSKELNNQLELTKNKGGDFAATIPQQYRRSFELNRLVPTSTPEQNARWMRELGTQLNSPQEGMQVAEIAGKISWLGAQYGKEDPDRLVNNLLKAAENRGQIYTVGPDGQKHIDMAKLDEEMGLGLKAIVNAGGLLKSNDILQMSKQGGIAARLASPTAFYTEMGEMAVSMGAPRVGTAATSLAQQLLGGSLSVQVAKNMERDKLLAPGEWRSDHGHAVLSQQALTRFSDAMRDLPKWVREWLVPHYESIGIHGQNAQMEAAFRDFSRATSQRFVAEAIQNAPQLKRAEALSRQQPSVSAQYGEMQANDLTTNEKSLAAAWQGLREAIGSPEAIKAEIAVIQSITDAIHGLTQGAVAHPEAVANILKLSAAISAIMALGGGLTVANFALGGFKVALEAFAGARVASALGLLTGATGLGALAIGIETLGRSLGFLPSWLVNAATGAAVGARVAGLPGAAAGAVAGGIWDANPGGLNDMTPASVWHWLWGQSDKAKTASTLAAAGVKPTGTPADAKAAAILQKYGITGPISSGLGAPAPAPSAAGPMDTTGAWLHDLIGKMVGGPSYLNAPPPPAQASPPEPDIHWQQPGAGSIMRKHPAQPYAPNRTALQSVQMSGIVNLDGRPVGHFVAKSLADQTGRPPAGPTAPDPRMSLPQPGQLAPTQ